MPTGSYIDMTDADRNRFRVTAPNRSEAGGVVTLEMVAKAAGVSPSTVSRILNGTARVSDVSRQAVDRAIRELGFRPNPVARALAGGRTMSIGVLTQTISSPYYGEALHGIEVRLDQAGYVPIFVSGHWREDEENKALETLLARRVDGLIVLAGRLSDQALRSAARSIPLVVAGRAIEGPNVWGFGFDDRAGAELATQHLLDCGHTRIAYISGDPAHADADERHAGYRAALARAGVAYDATLVTPGDYSETGGLMAVNRLLDARQPFTAIFAANDQMAIGAALGLYRRNIRVPDDVSLVGFDDLAPARFSIPPLTTVHQPVYDMGFGAAEAILALLQGDTPKVVLPPLQLVSRESVRRVRR